MPIRILYGKNNKYTYHAGGAIVWDSTAEDEWDETLVKTKFLQTDFQLIETAVDDWQRHVKRMKKSAFELGFKWNKDIEKIEIKPMFARILVQPFKQNPFQKIKVDSKSGIILDTGGMTKEYKNTDSGEWEEEQPFIITGAVIDCGPDVKYLQAGDVVFYRVDTAIPVPFFKQGLYSISENQIIAVVNDGLTERFNNIK